jgi:hypothetical protein
MNLNGIRRRLSALIESTGKSGCPNCIVQLVEIRQGEPVPPPLPCLNPTRCPGHVRRLEIILADPDAENSEDRNQIILNVR